MQNALTFVDKMRRGEVCLGTGICFTDPTVTEALCPDFDYVWIDMEHNALPLDAVQGHIMATKGTNVTPLVRVPWNDPVLIKPVLDIGAAGVIVPLVRSAEDVRGAVAACRYPPEGVRGFGPRRPSNYGRQGGTEFCQKANEDMITVVQIEHIDAVNDLDEILKVDGLTAVVVGPNDLAGSMGHTGDPRNPEVVATIDTVIEKTRATDKFVGLAIGDDPKYLIEWLEKGAQWLLVGTDFRLMLRGARDVVGQVRAHLGGR